MNCLNIPASFFFVAFEPFRGHLFLLRRSEKFPNLDAPAPPAKVFSPQSLSAKQCGANSCLPSDV